MNVIKKLYLQNPPTTPLPKYTCNDGKLKSLKYTLANNDQNLWASEIRSTLGDAAANCRIAYPQFFDNPEYTIIQGWPCLSNKTCQAWVSRTVFINTKELINPKIQMCNVDGSVDGPFGLAVQLLHVRAVHPIQWGLNDRCDVQGGTVVNQLFFCSYFSSSTTLTSFPRAWTFRISRRGTGRWAMGRHPVRVGT